MIQPQTVLTPLGLAKKDEKGLLVTNLRIIHTTPLKSVFEHKISLVDPSNIDHFTKRAHKNALEYYLNTKKAEVKKDLLQSLLQKYCKRDYVFDWEFNDLKDAPFEVVAEFNKTITAYKNKAFLEYSERQFLNYIWRIESESRYIRIRKKDGSATANKKLETRYSNSYGKKIEKRMKWLSHTYKRSQCVLLTLTLDPKKFDDNKEVMLDVIKPELDRFMKALRMRFKRDGRVFPPYIHAVEIMKGKAPYFKGRGNPHLHIVFFGAARLIDWRDIRDLWGNGFIYINKTKDGERVRNPVNYVTKYITKTFCNTNFDNVYTQSLLWIKGMRSFDRSKGLIVPLSPKSSGDWSLDYMVIMDRLDNRIIELDLIERRFDVMFNPSLWVDPPPLVDGKYYICSDGEGGAYSTDSPFWSSFFTEE